MAISQQELDQLVEAPVLDSGGAEVGRLGDVYLDDHSEQPLWATVRLTGGEQVSFVPLTDAQAEDGRVRLAHTAEEVRRAPAGDIGDHLEDDQMYDLYRHYGMDAGMVADTRAGDPVGGDVGADVGLDLSDYAPDRPASNPAAYHGGGDALSRIRLRRHDWPDHPTGMGLPAHNE